MKHRSAIVYQELDQQQLALTLARNQVGAKLPVKEVLEAEGVSLDMMEKLMADRLFTADVKRMAKELTENGFGFAAKSRVLAEDLLKTTYAIATDVDVAANTRLKAVENLVKWGDLEPKTSSQATTSGPGFTIQIVVPNHLQEAAIAEGVRDTLANRTPVVIDVEPETVESEAPEPLDE